MGTFFYDILIQPLIFIYDILFQILYGLLEDPILSIITLSIVINFIVLPLYWKADQIQRKEQEKQRKMKPWIVHIRRHFSGDERFMMQSAYYRIEHYNPLNVIQEAGPLALQIPFFMAAYHYISSIPLLKGASFGPIADLAAPDALLKIGGLSINILPIIMTTINFLSGYVYSKRGSLRQKMQIYGIGIVFLVLLYNSASGLVIYWIMNQLFSLGKNIYYVKKNDKLNDLLSVIAAILGIAIISILTVTLRVDANLDTFISECILAVSFITIVIRILKEKGVKSPIVLKNIRISIEKRSNKDLFIPVVLTEVSLALLLGFYIPSLVVSSSVTEFVDKTKNSFQSELIWYPIKVYVGLMIVWMTVIIFSHEGKRRTKLAIGLWVVLGIALVNQFLFDPHVGVLYSDLVFEGMLRFTIARITFNIIGCSIAAVGFAVLFLKKPDWMKSVAGIITAALFVLGMRNIVDIDNTLKTLQDPKLYVSEKRTLNLSRKGKNVIILMLDRAIGGYVPYIFDELPALKDSFRGFVYYPNTVSFGKYTNFGTPALFGGYEYVPTEINKRENESLKEKQNEALKVLPVLFSENDYDVTVCDPPYAGYQRVPDLSIYDGYDQIHAYNLFGKYTSTFNHYLTGTIFERQKRNFVMYSLFRTVPLFMKEYVYDNGRYLAKGVQAITGDFIDAYATLFAFPNITYANDDEQNYFLMLQNRLPHEPTVLEPPDYEVKFNSGKDNTEYTSTKYPYHDLTISGHTMKINTDWQWAHYCTNVATYKLVGAWLDRLKELGVYDNTRIIIVADHGRGLEQFIDLLHPDGLDVEFVWPVLLVKNFYSDSDFSTDTSFMTNADVATLATEDVIENPVNPFTGAYINNDVKNNGELWITDSEHFTITDGNTFDTSDGHWWSVHDDIFNMDNWMKLD